MKEKNSISVRKVDDSGITPFALKYFITRQEKAYGIEIEKYLLENGEELFAESEAVIGITDKYDEIALLTDRLADNLVTPTTLVYVIDDLFSEI